MAAQVVELPAGTMTLREEMRVPAGQTLRGHPKGTVLRAHPAFRGRALLVCESRAIVENLVVDGNRPRLERRVPIAPHDRDFIGFYNRNGLIADQAMGLTVRNVTFRGIPNFAAVVARSKGVLFDKVTVEDSGSRNAAGRNNTSGGILLEEGTSDFIVRGSGFRRVRGNAVWTHSRYESPRNGPGVIEGNDFEDIGRDAIQVGHATSVKVVRNTGRRIGWPVPVVDREGGGTPVAIDTAGNVDASVYAENRFEEINGKCIDLDGFHQGEVRGNHCVNRGKAAAYRDGHYGLVFNNTNPDMQSSGVVVVDNVFDGTKYGGIFVIGHGNTIRNNRLLRVNLARCNDAPGCLYDSKQPDLLRAGIYVGDRAERPAPAKGNTISGNHVSGYGMDRFCIALAPGVNAEQQTIEKNTCTNESSTRQ
jgi:hypothetical protein